MTLQVAFNNQIISNSVVFEYKARALPTLPSSQHDWLSLDGKNGILVTLLGIEGEELVCKCEKRRIWKRGAGEVSELAKGGPAESPLDYEYIPSVSLCLVPSLGQMKYVKLAVAVTPVKVSE